MRRWLRAVTAAAAEVTDRPTLWLPGALAWTVGIGWVALVAGVAQPPSVADLTFFGARVASSGLWPWNLVAGTVAVAVVAAVAFALAALAECALLRQGVTVRQLGRAIVVSLACAVPAAVMVLAVGAVLPLVAQAEFNAPDRGGDPLLRTLGRVAPLLGAVLVAAAAGAAVHASALRSVVAGRAVGAALQEAPGRLARIGAGSAAQPAVLLALRIGHLVLAAILLRVLWDPIGIRLADDGTDLATMLLLVGFVAIWLCLVLAGGALHAWGSVTWTRLLAAGEGGAAADPQQLEHRAGS